MRRKCVSLAITSLISIHALTRSATCAIYTFDLPDFPISIHALTRSATVSIVPLKLLVSQNLFQSTHSRGVRLDFVESIGALFQSTHSRTYTAVPISIHALTRSATAVAWFFDLVKIYFNPRTHEECDALPFLLFNLAIRDFNPRTHEECDEHLNQSLSHRYNRYHFNPRTHEECDIRSFSASVERYPFQSTHSRGVRHKTLCSRSRLGQFQSTHSRGVRPFAVKTSSNFNPRTHEECDTSGCGF